MKYTEIISRLLSSNLTSYKIAKDTDMTPQFVDNYRTGKSKVENMSLGKAETLVEYQQKLEENKMKNFTVVGKWWNDKNIELVNIEHEGTFALNGWNGEKYTSCWTVDENDLTVAFEGDYTITPDYTENTEDEYEVTHYYVEEN